MEKRKTLGIDLETFSEVDIKKGGLYKYAENSEILLFAYAFDDEPVEVVDFAQGEELPLRVYSALTDPDILKTAYNAAFEIHVINHWLETTGLIDLGEKYLDPAQWFCTMIQGWTLGLPGGLDKVGKVLNLAEDKQKLATGKKLIQYFSKPCKATKVNGGRTRNLPEHDPEKWRLFKEYCGQDVEAERAIRKRIEGFFPNKTERRLWCLDEAINDRGVMVDLRLVNAAIKFDEEIKEQAMDEARELTGMQNPNSNSQLMDWIEEQEGWRPRTLDKAARAEMMEQIDNPKVRKMLEIKNVLGKTSVKKYIAMKEAVCRDGRLHGMLQFYGAARTGRWAGRLVQLQNLPQNHLSDLNAARQFVEDEDFDTIQMLYENPSDVLSQLIRTAFIAKPGKRFIVADFSAIEARVIAWIADEKWRMKVFAEGGDIYCASATAMFHVPVVKHGENAHLRHKGKVAELACGYGGGVNALVAFGADKMGLSEADMNSIINKWRKASPNIVKMWKDVEIGFKKALRMKTATKYKKGIGFSYEKGLMFLTLPSGRRLAYVKPKIEFEEAFNRESLTYEGIMQTTSGWGRNYTWGGKLVENIVQGTARDCLAEAMLRLEVKGYRIVMHIHDEVVLEMPLGKGSLEEACAIMGEPISWAPGLLLTADGYETDETANYYRKD